MVLSADKHYSLKGLSSQVLSSIFVDLEMRNAGGIEARYCVSDLDDLRFVRATSHGGSYEAQRRNWHISAAGADHWFVCVPLRQSIRLCQDSRSCELQPGDLGFVNTQREYTVAVAAGGDALWVRMASSRLEWRLSSRADIFARRIRGDDGIGLLASRFARDVATQAERLPAASRAAVAAMLSDLLAEAATGLTGGQSERSGFRAGRERTLERARIYIEQHLHEDNLTPSRIAAALGMSSRYLAQLFATEGETTMGWVASRRLQRCRDRLVREVWRPGLITELALDCGFTNISSFNRAFRLAFGATPREFTTRDVAALRN